VEVSTVIVDKSAVCILRPRISHDIKVIMYVYKPRTFVSGFKWMYCLWRDSLSVTVCTNQTGRHQVLCPVSMASPTSSVCICWTVIPKATEGLRLYAYNSCGWASLPHWGTPRVGRSVGRSVLLFTRTQPAVSTDHGNEFSETLTTPTIDSLLRTGPRSYDSFPGRGEICSFLGWPALGDILL
jgi:hypothetical protein